MISLGKRIKIYRKKMNLNQTQLGKVLGKSYQQIQKYESGKDNPSIESLVKLSKLFNISLDQLILGKDDHLKIPIEKAKYLISNLSFYQQIQSGVSIDKLIEMIVFLATTCGLNKTKLNKMLFYTDFVHFREHNAAITNIPYVLLPNGPAPESYNAILYILQDTEIINIHEIVLDDRKDVVEEKIDPKKHFDKKLFNKDEMAVLRKIAFHLGEKTGAELSKRSHKEIFYDEIKIGSLIPYEFAKKLKMVL